MSNKYKEALSDLVDAIMESGLGSEVDAGCDSEGPLAKAMVVLGMYKNTFEASDEIFEE